MDTQGVEFPWDPPLHHLDATQMGTTIRVGRRGKGLPLLPIVNARARTTIGVGRSHTHVMPPPTSTHNNSHTWREG